MGRTSQPRWLGFGTGFHIGSQEEPNAQERQEPHDDEQTLVEVTVGRGDPVHGRRMVRHKGPGDAHARILPRISPRQTFGRIAQGVRGADADERSDRDVTFSASPALYPMRASVR